MLKVQRSAHYGKDLHKITRFGGENLQKCLTRGGKKLATNSHLISSTLHFSPQFSTTSIFATYLILLFIFITSIGNKSFLNSQFQPENCSNRQELAFFITLQNSYFRVSKLPLEVCETPEVS